MQDLPSGTITFLTTDIERSTLRWELDAVVMSGVRARHEAILHAAIAEHDGFVFKGTGDGVLATFATAPAALNAALTAQRALFAEDWGVGDPLRVRIALHTGTAEMRGGDYFGPTVNRVSRLVSAGHGGQILLSGVTAELIRDRLPPGVQLRDMGEARLKDLLRPLPIVQVVAPDLPTDFPPLKTLNPRRTNLPAQLDMLIGRKSETADVRALLLRDDVRLVTLTGPGGTGKTRLSLQIGVECMDSFPDGVFFVPLEDVVDPARVTSQIAEVLGVTEGGGLPLLRQLADMLRMQQLLLVMDNFEQVTAAGAEVGHLLAETLSLKVLVTSRAPLRLRGERKYPVPPLPLPDRRSLPSVERLIEYESIRLFVARAQEVTPDFTLTAVNAEAVVEICRRLDGLPLAIELAAARSTLFTPQELRAQPRLKILADDTRNRPTRQRTMHATLDWSYALLGGAEQMFFARMAVFPGGGRPAVGGGTLAAIVAVCNPEQDLPLDILDALASLVDASLLLQEVGRGGASRFSLLATIREYALERLETRGEVGATRRAHSAFYLALAEEAYPHLASTVQGAWVTRLEEEHDNLRVALRDALDAGDHAMAVRFVVACWRFWYVRGYLTEGRRWIERALHDADDVAAELRANALDGLGTLMRRQGDEAAARAQFARCLAIGRASDDPAITTHALSQLGGLACVAGDYATARRYYEECLAIRRQGGDSATIAHTLINLGITAQHAGDSQTAQAHFEESLAIARASGDRQAVAHALMNLGVAATRREEYGTARSRYEEGLAIAREMGDSGTASFALTLLGAVTRQQGDRTAARSFHEQSLALRRALGDTEKIAASLNNLGVITLEKGDLATARASFAECLAIRRELGDPNPLPFVLNNLALTAQRQGDVMAARAAYQESLMVSQRLANPRGIIRALEGIAGLVSEYEEGGRAVQLWGAVEALREHYHFLRVREEWELYAPMRDAARARTDSAMWERAWADGRTMNLMQAIEVAAPLVAQSTYRPPPPGVWIDN